MSGATSRQLRVLHVVSATGAPAALHASLFMPLLTRLPKQHVKAQVICLATGAVPAAVLRQQGVPVHEVALSRQKFSLGALKELTQIAQQFRPDIIQAWGHTAQLAALRVRKRCDWEPSVVWAFADTAPLPRDPGMLDRQKLKWLRSAAPSVDRMIFTSEAGAAQYRRVDFTSEGALVIQPGVDAARFKPELALRAKVRERLQLPADAFVVGMIAPFQPEYDHTSLIKGVGELIKTQPNLYLLLAGHGVQRGNAQLMALIGGGTLSTRTQLLGEWSDVCSFFNACDVACSTAQTDTHRMTLAMAMLCGVPCVGTGMGAQGEVIGQFGVAIEPGSPQAVTRGISRVLQLTPEKRAHLAQNARKHALQNFVHVRALQKYLQLYQDLAGRETTAERDVPAPEVEVTVPVRPKEIPAPAKPRTPVVEQIVDPDSLESQVEVKSEEQLPKWRIEQEQQRAKRDAELVPERVRSDGDVLEFFEQQIAKPTASGNPMGERARGVADESEELLPLEALAVPAAVAKSAVPSILEPLSSAKPAQAAAAAPTAAPVQTVQLQAQTATPIEDDQFAITTPSVSAMLESSTRSSDARQAEADVQTSTATPTIEEQLLELPAAPARAAVAEPEQRPLFDLELLPDTPSEIKRVVGERA